MLLTEGISHIEDLDVDTFIEAVSKIANMQASEKLDGSQLWVGIDEAGRLYTSRAGKRKTAENMYSADNYPMIANYNGFRATHLALEKEQDKIKNVLQPGETVELEVLFGRQPNAVTYGANDKNYIAFLRGVDGTKDEKADALAVALKGITTSVSTKIVDTTDGENLIEVPVSLQFQFVAAQKIDTSKVAGTNVKAQLDKLRNFLEKQHTAVGDDEYLNGELLKTPLNSFPKEIRPEAKIIKQQLKDKVQNDFKLPIKKELLDKFVGQVKSPLSAMDLHPNEDIGIEGVVLRDSLGNQIKIVDKDKFTTINKFNHSIRAAISGVIRTTDQNKPIEDRGGIVGEMKIRIADLLGNKDLARGSEAKKIFAGLKGPNLTATAKAAENQFQGASDFQATKRKILADIESTQHLLKQNLDTFKKTKDKLKLRLKSGKVLGLSDANIKKTLLTFAEAKRDLDQLHEKISKTTRLAQIIVSLYGKHLLAVQNAAEEITEQQVLTETHAQASLSQFQNKDSFTLINGYLATLLTSMVFFKADFSNGIRTLRDHKNQRMTKWDPYMSNLNLWGYIIWRATSTPVKKIIGVATSKKINRWTHLVAKPRWLNLHMRFSFGSEKKDKIDWEDCKKIIKILQREEGINTHRINKIIDDVLSYDTAEFDKKVKTLNQLYYYLVQFVPISPLLIILAKLQKNLLIGQSPASDQMINENKKLNLLKDILEICETAEGGTTAAGGGASATTASAIAPIETRIFHGNRPIERRKRNSAINKNKFSKPKSGQ